MKSARFIVKDSEEVLHVVEFLSINYDSKLLYYMFDSMVWVIEDFNGKFIEDVIDAICSNLDSQFVAPVQDR